MPRRTGTLTLVRCGLECLVGRRVCFSFGSCSFLHGSRSLVSLVSLSLRSSARWPPSCGVCSNHAYDPRCNRSLSPSLSLPPARSHTCWPHEQRGSYPPRPTDRLNHVRRVALVLVSPSPLPDTPSPALLLGAGGEPPRCCKEVGPAQSIDAGVFSLLTSLPWPPAPALRPPHSRARRRPPPPSPWRRRDAP